MQNAVSPSIFYNKFTKINDKRGQKVYNSISTLKEAVLNDGKDSGATADLQTF